MEKENLAEILKNDPGNPVFADYADELRKKGDLSAALEVCLSGLSINEDYPRGKLVLARIFYLKGYLPFAIRELKEIAQIRPDSQRIKRLLDLLAPHEAQAVSTSEVTNSPDSTNKELAAETLAEADFDFDDLDLD